MPVMPDVHRVQISGAKAHGHDDRRGTSTQRGYGAAWRKARAGFLRTNPLCAECMRNNRITQANVVDHIVAHKGNQALFWDQSNWQPLCKRCHDQKTAKQDGGFGRVGGG